VYRGRELLGVAKRWYERGILPLPLHARSKRPAISWYDWQHERPEWATIESVFNTKFYRNIGLLTGPISDNLIVLDFDKPLPYVKWRRCTDIRTYTVRTGRGYHCYLRLRRPPVGTLSMDGGEIKGSGYVVAPPSTHPNGVEYVQYGDTTDILEFENLMAAGIELLTFETPKRRIPTTASGPQSRGSASSNLVHEIKQQLSITAYLSNYTEFVPSGNGWLMCHCPFHADTIPSMWVSISQGLCRCFSPTCIAHGTYPLDVINVYALMNHLSNRNAIIRLAADLGIL
jgi:hypothetical protein